MSIDDVMVSGNPQNRRNQSQGQALVSHMSRWLHSKNENAINCNGGWGYFQVLGRWRADSLACWLKMWDVVAVDGIHGLV